MLGRHAPPPARSARCFIPVLIDTPLIWPLVFLWGAALVRHLYVALVSFGQRFSGSMLVAGNAAFALMWGIGGISGPSVTGAIMNAVGVEALPFVLALVCLVLVAVRLTRLSVIAGGAGCQACCSSPTGSRPPSYNRPSHRSQPRGLP